MPWGAAAVAGATIAGSYISAQGAQNAANTQANAAAAQQQNLLAAGQQASQQFTPYAGAGTTALANLASNNAYFNNQFSNADLNANLSPNYAFQLQQGQQTNLMANNATGGAVSGNSLQALNKYSQDYAGTAYQNAFSNYQAQRSNIYNQNIGQAQLGLAGATGSANAQLGTATNVAQLGIGSAKAQAASQVAQGQIYGNAANSLGNIAYLGYQNAGTSPINSSNAAFGSGGGGGGFIPTSGNSFTVA